MLIPISCDYVTLHGKREFADVIKAPESEAGRVAWRVQVGPVQSLGPFAAENFLWLESEEMEQSSQRGSQPERNWPGCHWCDGGGAAWM